MKPPHAVDADRIELALRRASHAAVEHNPSDLGPALALSVVWAEVQRLRRELVERDVLVSELTAALEEERQRDDVLSVSGASLMLVPDSEDNT